ncbi:uncharacterized protein LOC131072193 [Cryptomeria japonica]|uniref:uncharacterized protein LOC131072193 n=1 Tax=Cryptomeria japonica TaxID=3369 RepID=UPI0025AB6F84|nr:uncharacterized protein LOC131072193 [Cryptomeria japonica]
MELHTKFTEPARKRKVAKIVEDILVEEGHPREKVRDARAARDAVEKAKKQKTAPAPIKVKVTGSSPAPVKTPPTESEPSSSSTKGKGVLRKNQKPQREYVAVSLVASKTESDADIPNASKKGEFARVIRKPQCSAEKKEQKEKKAKSDLVSTSKPKRGKKIKYDLDEAIESGKMKTTQTEYHIIPPLSTQELIDEIIKDGNLKNIFVYYKNMDDKRKSASQMHREIKESQLVNQCTSITIEEIDRLILLANKKEFGSTHGVNSLMVGRVEEIRRETSAIWNKFLTKNRLVETVSRDEATQSKNSLVNDVNKEEDTQDVAEQQILDSVEVKPVKENDKSVEEEDGAPSGDTGAQEAPKEDKTRQVEAEKKEEEK